MTTDHANGTPLSPEASAMLDALAPASKPQSALARLSAQDRAMIEGWNFDALAENFAKAHLAFIAQSEQTQRAMQLGAVARLALAHLLARHHRGLVDQHGHAVDLGCAIALESQWAPLLPSASPLVDVIPLDAKGAPWTSPAQGAIAVLDVKVTAAAAVVVPPAPEKAT